MQAGIVYLVGAGPGDPQLITLRGAECLRRADVVVYDALVNVRLLELASPHAECVPAGKRHGQRSMTQEAINQLMVERALAGQCVVRLKGGDPFVFGRGGEEAAALRASGMRYEIVPGVTAGVAAPACAGIPVTHRELASAVAFITGHEDPCKTTSTIDWSALARFPGTLVFYMGVSRLAGLAESLTQHGLAADTPVAVIRWGATPAQKSVTGTLSEIAARVHEAGVCAPAVVVVGRVVSLAEQLRWFEERPLFGQCIVITRPAHQASPLAERLADLGAEVLELPALRIEPPESWEAVDRAIAELNRYGWVVFTSANGVSHFLDRVLTLGRDARELGPVRIAAIGVATARELERYRLRADLTPDDARSESLVDTFRSVGSAGRLLLLRADRGREALTAGLRAAGIAFDEVAVYRNIEETRWDPEVVDRIVQGQVDWITLTSSGVVRSLLAHLPEQAKTHLGVRTKLASISPITTQTARELGRAVAAEAATSSMDALVDAIVEQVQRQKIERG